ncbi:MAG: arginine--tRNA ligase, partial [Candidatus Marinimicrobia bacterium]|nr:arginine--tRNA ligase [Candidatus Neomarinimicrobiota bacterium]
MKDNIISKIELALKSLDFPIHKITVEIPRNPDHGDFSTNIAMTLVKVVKQAPQKIAQQIIQQLFNDNNDNFFEDITLAGPGFINFKINPNFVNSQLKDILVKSENYGKSEIGNGQTVLVEFVSANPTGPLTVGHGRGAILGDTVGNILEWNGYTVQREYYFNDAGRQMRVLAQSVYARYLETLGESFTFPEDGYQGEYIHDIARTIFQKHGDSLKDQSDSEIFKKTAESIIFEDIKKSLSNLGVIFDTFFNEHTLYDSGEIEEVLNVFRDKKLLYEKDNATWFKGTAVGRNVDKVLIKSTGEPTYRLPDIAYHQNKFRRNYDLIVDVFGADHADTIPDVIAGIKELDFSDEKMKVLIHQFVTIMKDGVQVKMSTRKATFITLDELSNDVGVDVVRYFFLMRGMNTHLNFDINLA